MIRLGKYLNANEVKLVFELTKKMRDPQIEEAPIYIITILFPQSRDGTRSIATQERQLISSTHAGGGGQYLTDRSWKGLEQQLGNAPPLLAVEGQTGIAGHYIGEGESINIPADTV